MPDFRGTSGGSGTLVLTKTLSESQLIMAEAEGENKGLVASTARDAVRSVEHRAK